MLLVTQQEGTQSPSLDQLICETFLRWREMVGRKTKMIKEASGAQ